MGTKKDQDSQLQFNQEFHDEPSISGLLKPIKMGHEQEFLARRENAINSEAEIQQTADLDEIDSKEVSLKTQLFGIGVQYNSFGVLLEDRYAGVGIDLDSKYDSTTPFKIETDHMFPLIPPFSDVKIRFSTDFKSGEICVYTYRGEIYCNQIIIEDGKILARSVNPKYKPIYLDRNEFHFIAVIDSVHYFLKGR